MSQLMWSVVTVGAGALILWGVARVVMRAGQGRGPAEPLPPTPLQHAAWWSLGLGILFSGGAAAVWASVGVEQAMLDPAHRIASELLAIAAIIAAAGGVMRLVSAGWRGAAGLDERDRSILDRAPAVQSVATILALAVWTVVLTERFVGVGTVPLAYVPIVFWSCLLVNLLALPVGVLAGYRKL
jgi:hypothetical protein